MANCAFEYEKNTPSYEELVRLQGPIVAAGIMAMYNGRPPRRFFEESVAEMEEKDINETQRFTEVEQREIVDSLTYEFINELKNQSATELLGEGVERGTIPLNMLRNSYIVAETGEMVSAERAKKLYELESKLEDSTLTDEEYDAALDAFEAESADILRDEDGAPVTKDGSTGLRETYFDIYHYWNGGISTVGKSKERVEQDRKARNQDITGWRELLERRVNASGYALKQKDLGYEVADDQEILEKIYGKSVVEEDPSKKLTGKIKQLLATLPSGKTTFLGYNSFIDADTVYADLAKEFAGAPNFESMKLRMENLSKHKPQYAPVSRFMQTMNKRQAAQFRSAFSLSKREFIMMRIGVIDGAVKSITSNPNMNSVEVEAFNSWRAAAYEGTIENPRAIYTLDKDKKLTLKNPSIINNVIKPNAKIAIEAAMRGEDVTTIDGSIHPAVQAYANVTYALGINLSPEGTLEKHAENIQSLVNNGHTVSDLGMAVTLKGSDMFNHLVDPGGGIGLKNIVSSFVKVTTPQKTVVYEAPAAVIANIYNTRSAAIQHIAKFTPMFKPNRGDAFVNMAGNVIHPINLPHNLSRTIEALQTPGTRDVKAGTIKANMLAMYNQSKFHSPTIDGRHKSVLLQALEDAGFGRMFKVEVLDGIRSFGDMHDYENFAETQSLNARLTAWYNNANQSVCKIAIPTQSDRTQLAFVTLPRFSSPGSRFGIDQKTRKEMLKDLIIQDLVRIHEAEKVVGRDGTIYNQEVYDRNENYYKDGKAASDRFMQLAGTGAVSNRELRNENNQNLTPRMSDKIETYLEVKRSGTQTTPLIQEMDAALDEMVNGVEEFLEGQKELLLSKMNSLGIQYGQESFWDSKDVDGKPANKLPRGVNNIEEFAEAFIFDDMLGRLEVAKILRGPMAQFKNEVDFYKRMALVTTPGIEVTTTDDIANAAEVDGISNYGMAPTFTELVLEDFKLDLTPQQIERVNATAQELYQAALDGGLSQAEAARIRDAYKQETGGIDATDAQSFITLKHYRDIEQGLGNWGIEEEQAYKAYEQTGRFEYQPGFTPEGFNPGDAVPINPQKPFYEKIGLVDGVISTDVTKNSYHVLLANETADNPVKDALRRRMEDPSNPIDVVNFRTTKKARQSNVADLKSTATDPLQQQAELEARLSQVKTNTLDSKSLRFPQIIPAKKSDLATFNRQVRKNTLANVQDNNEYFIDAGTSKAQKISGKDLKRVYHQTINKKIQLNINQLKTELNIAALDKAQTAEQRQRALRNIHQELRRIIQEENIERDLPDNYSKGLQIIEDAAGNPQFELSLDFPTYYEKFERIVLGIAVNRAFKQKLSGEEAVQVADVGGYATSEELKFYSIEKDPNGRPLLAHMEVAVRADIAAKLGLKEGQEISPEQGRLLGYRIPNQGKSSTVIMKVKKILPNNYKKAIIVPGQITKLTGSDFDIDKMILIFPEMRSTEKGPVKVSPPYQQILSGGVDINNITDESILNNIIYDTIESIQSSVHHFNETMAPLDETTLENLAKEMEEATGIDPQLNFNSFTAEIDSGIRNTLGVALRGLWANALAGHSVAQHGVINVKEEKAIKLVRNGVTETNDTLLSAAPSNVDPIDADVPINVVLSRYLSSAVDAGKKPFQYALNDNVATFPVELYWTTFTGDTKSLHYFLNHPTIRQATELVQGKYGGDVSKFQDAFGEVIGLRIKASDLEAGTIPMSVEQLKDFSLEPADAALNFLKFLKAGRELRDMFKVIAPDSMDGMNSADSLKSYKSRGNKFDQDSRLRGETIFYGPSNDPNPTTQFFDENGAFPMSAGFNDLFTAISEDLGARLFPKVFSPALAQLEVDYMEATGKDQVKPEEMKELRRAAMLYAMTREGSPLKEFFSETHLRTRYLNREDNLVTQFTGITEKNPKLKENKFIAKFTQNKNNETEAIMLLDFDTSQKMSKFEKDSIIQDARRLMEFPEEFASNPQDRDSVREIQDLVEDLFANALIVNGFRISNNSYADLIPIEFFTETRYSRYGQEGMQKGERFSKSAAETYKDQNMIDQNYFSGFVVDFLRQHATRYAGGSPIVSVKKVGNLLPIMDGSLVSKDRTKRPIYKVFKSKTTEEAAVYRLAENGMYYRLNTLGGRIMESPDLGSESIVNPIEDTSMGSPSSFVSLGTMAKRQAPRKTLDSLRDRVTGQDRTDIICK